MSSILPLSEKKVITLVGMPGVGKTVIGSGIAQKLNVKFLDTDHEIEKIDSRTITEIYDSDGPDRIKELESKIISSAIKMQKPCVLSTGSETFVDNDVREMLKNNTITISLIAPFNVIFKRIVRRATRPMLENGDKMLLIKELVEARTELYKESDICIKVSSMNKDETIQSVLDALREYISKARATVVNLH